LAVLTFLSLLPLVSDILNEGIKLLNIVCHYLLI
jgi:hypothetical protein